MRQRRPRRGTRSRRFAGTPTTRGQRSQASARVACERVAGRKGRRSERRDLARAAIRLIGVRKRVAGATVGGAVPRAGTGAAWIDVDVGGLHPVIRDSPPVAGEVLRPVVVAALEREVMERGAVALDAEA